MKFLFETHLAAIESKLAICTMVEIDRQKVTIGKQCPLKIRISSWSNRMRKSTERLSHDLGT
jgi:hypothetical protein